MSTRLLLDGDDLRSLMLRVRDEMGPDARIVRAERVRSGGIAGFFAKEHYELTVEVPEKPRRRLGRTRPAPPVDPSRPEGTRGEPVGIDALMAAAEEAERAPVSTASDSFAQVLASVQAMVGPVDGSGAGRGDGSAGGSADGSAGGSAGGSADGSAGGSAGGSADGSAGEADGRGSRADGDGRAGTAAGPDGAAPGGVGSTPGRDGGAAAVAAAWAPAAFPVLAAGAGAAAVTAAGDVAGARATAGSSTAGRRDASSGEVGVDGEVDAAAVGPDSGPEPAGAADDPVRPRSSVAALLELGIPTRLLAGFSDPHAPVALSRLVRAFDRPRGVRLAPGAVVVVAGPAELALRTATQMAHRAGLGPHDVVLAGDIDPVAGHGRRVTTAVAAARVRERAAVDAPTVVALGVGATGAAADLLAALAPDEAWAALDARLRGVELRRWLRAVGARRGFDAVAALNTFEAQAPGTVLNLGVPVGWVDGLPASPVVWAAVLSERLADDARWD